jgi:hypothetical protein
MPRIADSQTPAGLEKRSHDRRCEDAYAREDSELLIEEPNEFCLIEAINEPAHERPQISRARGDRSSMSRHIRKQQPANSARGATGRIINVPAVLRVSIGFAINPCVQPSKRNPFCCELASAPDFHTLHLLRRLATHETHYTRNLPAPGG